MDHASRANSEQAAAAIAALLRSVGAPLESDPELRETPQRAARMMIDELLDGYAVDPAEVLREAVHANDPGLVVVANIRYVSMCPHHMLPSTGRAHIGYFPSGRVAGLGTLVRLLEAFAHRLVLQEALGQQVCDALVSGLGARGAGVMLRARHQCLSVRGEKQSMARVITVAHAGSMTSVPEDRALFHQSVPPWPRARK